MNWLESRIEFLKQNSFYEKDGITYYVERRTYGYFSLWRVRGFKVDGDILTVVYNSELFHNEKEIEGEINKLIPPGTDAALRLKVLKRFNMLNFVQQTGAGLRTGEIK